MINWDKINKKISLKKIILPIFVVITVLVILLYILTFRDFFRVVKFEKQMEMLAKENEIPEFSISEIYLCSSASVDEGNKMKDNLKIYQYTDFVIQINNYQDEKGITKRNTIRELYIDSISIFADESIGKQYLVYCNPYRIGDKSQKVNIENKNKIEYNIINTNIENENADYSTPTFYADCSNPITLRYLNDLNSQYSIEKDKVVNFDGSLLKEVGIENEKIKSIVEFKITIVSNDGKEHNCWLKINIPLDDIYNGTTLKAFNFEENKYNFFTM